MCATLTLTGETVSRLFMQRYADETAKKGWPHYLVYRATPTRPLELVGFASS
jgi:hypothetical protein